jgi:hypothetical protein
MLPVANGHPGQVGDSGNLDAPHQAFAVPDIVSGESTFVSYYPGPE